MAATLCREGDVLLEVQCRCGGVLVRRSSYVDRCERCNSTMKVISTVTLGPGGSTPHPDEWVPA